MSDSSHEALIFRPFVKDQSCQCNLNKTYQPLRKSYSLESFPEFSTEHEKNPHYCFSSLDIKKPSGAKPSLGLTFDRDGNRPPILRSIDSKGCFANVKEISSGDRLVFVDNALYGVKTLADVKQHFINTEEGTVLKMCWLRRIDGFKNSACCSPKCLAIRDRLDELNYLLRKTRTDYELEVAHEKKEFSRMQEILDVSLKKAHVAVASLSTEVESLKEASHFLQSECEQQVSELRRKLQEKQAELDSLTVPMQIVDSRVHSHIPLENIPMDPQQFRAFFEHHRELYRRYLLEAVSENATLQSRCAGSQGELIKLAENHAAETAAKDEEILNLKMQLQKELDMNKGNINQLDELFIRNLALEDELRQKKSEIESLAQTQNQIAQIASHDEVVDTWMRKCQSYEMQLNQAKHQMDSMQLQNASLKVQLKNNEQSLQELRESMLSDSGYIDRLSHSSGNGGSNNGNNSYTPQSQS